MLIFEKFPYTPNPMKLDFHACFLEKAVSKALNRDGTIP